MAQTQQVSDILETLCYWERKRQEQIGAWPSETPKQGPTIAISRTSGVDAGAVAHEIGNRLQWAVYDRELLKRIAQDAGLRESLLESVDEKKVSWLEETFETVIGVPYVSEAAYVHQVIRTVLALAAGGECVIVGRGAAAMLPPRTTLRVRITAPLANRIEFLRHKHTITSKDAARLLMKKDREHRAFIQAHFHKDPRDPDLYDVILNFARLGVSGCADVAARALASLQSTQISEQR
jgi:cytidylate kinase